MAKRSANPDVNELAARIVGEATGEPTERTKNPAAVALGKLGGKVGGNARAEKLSPERRKEIAKAAARKRWGVTGDENAE
jgi:hypothetical protein